MGLIRADQAHRCPQAGLIVCNHFPKKGEKNNRINIPGFPPFAGLEVKFPFISVGKMSICPIPGVERKDLHMNFWISNLPLPLRPTK